MARILPAVVALLAFAVLAGACSGGDSATPSAAPRRTPTATDQPSGTSTQPRSPTVSSQQTPTTGPATATSTASPEASGTLAIAPADLSRYQGQTIIQEECQFHPRTATAVCTSRGTYSLVPPPTGDDISCSVLIVQNQVVALGCSSQQPQQTVYYAVQ